MGRTLIHLGHAMECMRESSPNYRILSQSISILLDVGGDGGGGGGDDGFKGRYP